MFKAGNHAFNRVHRRVSILINMNPGFQVSFLSMGLALAFATLLPASAAEFFQPQSSKRHDPTVTHAPYKKWPAALHLDNGLVQVTVVPETGRVMQFGFLNEDGVLWGDDSLAGQSANPKSKEWVNFGGDKTWPSPQAEWQTQTGRAWPPPVAFDAMPLKASVETNAILLTSPVDPHYGIRTERRIELLGREPAMRIVTRYHKLGGEPVRTGIWIITQLIDPVRVYAPAQPGDGFPEGFVLQSAQRPPSLQRTGNLLSLTRHPTAAFKIGTTASALLWVGQRHMLLIESPRTSDQDYPDHGSSAEIYTNPDPKPYVELEMLGPLSEMKTGDHLEHTVTYTLLRRSPVSPDEEAQKALRSR